MPARTSGSPTGATRSRMIPYLETMPASHQTGLRRTLSQQIRDTLVHQIVFGELGPGERLVETKVAAQFGTSQAPVREALRELEAFGLVEIKPRRGTFIRSSIREALRESYVLRAALEETATRLVLLTGSVPIDHLERDIAEMYRMAEKKDVEAVGVQTVAFHRHIIEAAGNDLIARTWENLQIEAWTSVTMLASTPELTTIADDHQALLDSLTSGDFDIACNLARQHQWGYAELPHDPSRA